MPDNVLTRDCLHRVGGAQLFMSPTWTPEQKGVKVQILDVFALKLAIGYEKDPNGRLLLLSEASVSAGRTWSLAKACQLVRNDTNPNRWVVLHRHKKAWGLFWAGGGLNQCRDELSQLTGTNAAFGSIVPATPEELLRLVLSLEEPNDENISKRHASITNRKQASANNKQSFPWKTVALTSAFWMLLSAGTVLYVFEKACNYDRVTNTILPRYFSGAGQ
jgi:hypothetical protein